MVKTKKIPKYLRVADSGKNPSIDKKIISELEGKPAWQVQFIDLDGRWSWLNLESDQLIDDILPSLKNFESMDWNEILGRNNHAITIDRIISDAKRRLRDLKHDDTDSLISLRLTGKKRIWGIKVGHVLKLLWWDPQHEICPSLLRYT